MINWIRKYWFPALMFTLAVSCDAVMDYINFQVPYDSGFWSLHTSGLRFDAWHILKVMKWLFIAWGMVRTTGMIFVLGLLNYFFHTIIYHKILKRE